MDWFTYLIDAIDSDTFRNLVVLDGAAVAIVSLISGRVTAIRSKSADVIFAMRDCEPFSRGIASIAKHHASHDSNIRGFVTDPAKRGTPEALDIIFVLNYFEGVSIGIQEDIYSEPMFKRNYWGTLVRSYERALPLIQAMREIPGKGTTYQELSWLAERWKRKPLKTRKLAKRPAGH